MSTKRSRGLSTEQANKVHDQLSTALTAHDVYTKGEIARILNDWYVKQNLNIYRKISKK